MDSDEAIQRHAEAKAASLHNLGWEVGAGATIWARAARDELARHEEARASWSTRRDKQTFEQIHASAYMLIVAVDQVLAHGTRVRKLTGDAALQKARRRFDGQVPHAETIRDLVAHLDEYATGQGQRQVAKRTPPIREKYLSVLLYWTENGRTYLHLGQEQIDLKGAAEEAVKLAEVVEDVRARYLRRAEEEANEALRRRCPRSAP
jgi:hypothetical protein